MLCQRPKREFNPTNNEDQNVRFPGFFGLFREPFCRSEIGRFFLKKAPAKPTDPSTEEKNIFFSNKLVFFQLFSRFFL
ncbi:hypothetical protein M5M_08327 [Simiduia agarivorans SA1 = DSM 21679]|uniref:Uncharacterized protein n=1 Tax=Simiduia agarivorans (strain DSM 21679 / JCM 13881 / BCRC 17597 / SA1) TaxID=1117647 RepID=R9S4Z7_SIMAS|nr:hypothetical protein M5M_08327 [Simiduia agarivorans SA1 = DSM 21679]